MFARLVRTPKALAWGVALAAGLLYWVPVSQAAVFAGSATDPAGDLGLDVGDDLPSPPVDFTHVSVRYDDVAGRVDVSFTLNQAPASSEQLEASVALGFVEPNGSCSTPSSSSRIWHGPIEGGAPRGQAVVRGVSLGFTGSVGGWVYRPDPGFHGYVEEGWVGTALFDWPGSQQESWNCATTHPLLVAKHYTCVRAAMAIATLSNSGSGWGTDELDRDVFALQPAVVALPSALWLSPKDGQTVWGKLTEGGAGAHNCAVKVTGPVVRTENYVDGKLNDTQAFAPWSCEWDTRNYVNGGHRLTVRAYDAANNMIATDTVRVTVDNPEPPPTDSPPPPAIETSPGVVVPSGSTGTQPGDMRDSRARRHGEPRTARSRAATARRP